MIKKLIRKFLNRIISLYIKRFKHVSIEGDVIFRKVPLVLKHKTAMIKIGEGSLINSSNKGYHVSMFQRCKLYADRSDAKILIGRKCRIHGTCLHAYNEIKIGNNCLIAANTQIIDGNGHEKSFENINNRINTTDMGRPIIIEDNVWISTNCIILGGTTIGEGSIITAGSIVKADVPSKCIWGGNPSKIIKQY